MTGVTAHGAARSSVAPDPLTQECHDILLKEHPAFSDSRTRKLARPRIMGDGLGFGAKQRCHLVQSQDFRCVDHRQALSAVAMKAPVCSPTRATATGVREGKTTRWSGSGGCCAFLPPAGGRQTADPLHICRNAINCGGCQRGSEGGEHGVRVTSLRNVPQADERLDQHRRLVAECREPCDHDIARGYAGRLGIVVTARTAWRLHRPAVATASPERTARREGWCGDCRGPVAPARWRPESSGKPMAWPFAASALIAVLPCPWRSAGAQRSPCGRCKRIKFASSGSLNHLSHFRRRRTRAGPARLSCVSGRRQGHDY